MAPSALLVAAQKAGFLVVDGKIRLSNYDLTDKLVEIFTTLYSKKSTEKTELEIDRQYKKAIVIPEGYSGKTLSDKLKDFERSIIIEVLDKNHGNAVAAAKVLGITPRQFRYRMEILNIKVNYRGK